MTAPPVATPLAEAELARLDALLAAIGATLDAEELGAALGRLLPGVKCRYCDAADVLEEPYRATERVHVHLLDLQGHCIRVTSEVNEATGLLLASVAGEGGQS